MSQIDHSKIFSFMHVIDNNNPQDAQIKSRNQSNNIEFLAANDEEDKENFNGKTFSQDIFLDELFKQYKINEKKTYGKECPKRFEVFKKSMLRN